ncbi:MAG TPA: hypothetical protein DCL38_09170 [Lachnospiraceae bacterium]|nr:hypothetical protein [Lachnospiraceae bacterium]
MKRLFCLMALVLVMGLGSSREAYAAEELKLSFDASSGRYRYTKEDGTAFLMEVPLGGCSNTAVTVLCENGSWISCLERDGEILTKDEEKLSEFKADIPGSWYFNVSSKRKTALGSLRDDHPAGFTVVMSGAPRRLDLIPAPVFFKISSVRFNGLEQELQNDRVYEARRDGVYELTFTSPGVPDWSFSFLRDSTPPGISFDRDIGKETVEGPVSFKPSEAKATVRVYFGNEEIANEGVLTEAGRYRLVAADEAGNEREYEFLLTYDGSVPPRYFIYFFTALLIAAALITAFAGRSMRIL